MKKMIYFLGGICISSLVWAQSYTFTAGTKLYTELTQAQWSDTSFGTYFTFKPLYPFELFGKTVYDSVYVGTQTGYVVVSDVKNGFAMDPMMGTIFRKIKGKSSIKAQTMMNAKEQVLVIQWKDIGFYGHSDAEYTNFQLWYSYTTGKITYHYGPSNLTTLANDSVFYEPKNTGPEILLVWLTPDFANYKEFHSVTGNKNSPVFIPNYARFDGLPMPNQTFTFFPTVFNSVQSSDELQHEVRIYPNPSNGGIISVETPENIERIRVRNMLGQEIGNVGVEINGNKASLKIDDPKQPLWVEITLTNGLTSIKQIHIY